jgi:cytoskeletal protein CcmA (bactofilin family)
MADPTPGRGDQGEFTTVIGADAQFKGELTFQGGVRIDGQLEGSVQTQGRILVSKGGKLKAEVKAGSVAVEGLVEGNLTADDKVELRATAQLRGDVKASKLLVVEGATFVGRCEVGTASPGVGAAAGGSAAGAADTRGHAVGGMPTPPSRPMAVPTR